MSGVTAIRGATVAEVDSAEAIDRATRELLIEMVDRNGVDPAGIVAIWITQSSDLTSIHAPSAARTLGWAHVALLGAQEAPVAGQLARVVRALMLVPSLDGAPRHVYIGAARTLRPDLTGQGEKP